MNEPNDFDDTISQAEMVDGAVNPTDEETVAKMAAARFNNGLVEGAVRAVADTTSEADAQKLAEALPHAGNQSHYS